MPRAGPRKVGRYSDEFKLVGSIASRGLQVRMRVRRRKHMALHRGPAPVPTGRHQRWSMDFVHDALADGRPFRVLTAVDQWSRQSPILEVASNMSGLTVGAALD